MMKTVVIIPSTPRYNQPRRAAPQGPPAEPRPAARPAGRRAHTKKTGHHRPVFPVANILLVFHGYIRVLAQSQLDDLVFQIAPEEKPPSHEALLCEVDAYLAGMF